MYNQPIVCYSHLGEVLIKNYSHEEFFSTDEIIEKLNQISQSELNFIFRINFEFFKTLKLQTQKEKLYHLPLMDLFTFEEYEAHEKNNINNNLKIFQLSDFKPLVSNEIALCHLNKIKENISNGHFYQVNYSIPFKGKIEKDVNLFDLFCSLRGSFTGNYHAFLPLSHNSALLSYSPELFFHLTNKTITTEPIKGTVASGNESNLLSSEKENAELSMIVDLLRNDLNSLSSNGAKVEFHRELMYLNHLTHTFSRISAETDYFLGDILSKILPGGSISGCPKKESVKTILELEPYQREFYTGVLGMSLNKTITSSILIRSLMAYNNGDFFYHSGAGIVESSKPNEEIEEIYLKAKSILNNTAWSTNE